jgi:hypothetical protein
MVSLLLATCLYFFSPASSQSPPSVDITGRWIGTITQNEGGYKSEYSFEMYLRKEDGKIVGRSYVSTDKIFAEMELEGELLNDSYFRWEESKIVESDELQGMEWCLKRGQLLLKKKKDVWRMEGFWQGSTTFSDCIPGKVYLRKTIPRA